MIVHRSGRDGANRMSSTLRCPGGNARSAQLFILIRFHRRTGKHFSLWRLFADQYAGLTNDRGPRTRKTMSIALPSALFAVSIDLELDPMRHERNQSHSLDAAAKSLVRVLSRYRTPATWAVADPAISAATDQLLADELGHEIAVLGDRTWVGKEAGRMRFGRELARRVGHARAAGIPLTTLALRGIELVDHLDLVVKQEISVVCSDYRDLSTGWFARPIVQAPAALRFGLWEVPPTMQLPADRGFSLWYSDRRRSRKAIDRAIQERGIHHLRIDALSFAERGDSAERTLDQILRYATTRAAAGALEIVPLRVVAQRLAGERTSTPARSILTPAA